MADGGPGGRRGGGSRESSAYPPDSAAGGVSGQGAFEGGRRQWLHAFDPGRPGVRAMAAVAVVVVLVAGFLAWKSRPQVDEVVSDGAATVSGVTPAASVAPVGELVVAVGGKVRKPGLVRLAAGSRVADALEAAGGAQPGVDVAPLNLARKVVDGELIMVGVSPPPGAATGGAAPGAAGGLINLNTATLGQLDTLPGVGPVLAQRILDARDAQGGFRAVTDLRKVDGIGESRYEQLKDLVTV
ncbi:helix-hairpin-helix domain-containing protein [Actinoplanes sichuanensis]|uniref:Helix-hairpin-helix domain-containing protein n=1 Tax=Actinoplanes sichuanensis TaxID=512349 RepID=A0ABW4A8U1_9ACTN